MTCRWNGKLNRRRNKKAESRRGQQDPQWKAGWGGGEGNRALKGRENTSKKIRVETGPEGKSKNNSMPRLPDYLQGGGGGFRGLRREDRFVRGRTQGGGGKSWILDVFGWVFGGEEG